MSTDHSSGSQGLSAAALRLEIASDIHADAAAAVLGLNRTDYSCLRLLFAEGAMTAGRLATLTGLTTGAITGILDRLERLGLVRRDTDHQDRRRVIALIPPEARPRLEPLVLGTARATAPEADSGEVARFLASWTEALAVETERLRDAGSRANLGVDAMGGVAVPLGQSRRGSFEIVGGAMDVHVTGGRAMAGQLARARLDGALTLSERDGHVRLAHRARAHLGRPSAEVELNAELPWTLRLSGGANHAVFELGDIDVTAVDMEGGAARAQFVLGEPVRAVGFRINGGASQVTVRRPGGVPVRVSARGKLELSVDGATVALSGDAPWRSPGFDEATARIDITVKGGMNTLDVESSAAAQGGPNVRL
jgi:DNA-binding MarR family transcriptional regulator